MRDVFSRGHIARAHWLLRFAPVLAGDSTEEGPLPRVGFPDALSFRHHDEGPELGGALSPARQHQRELPPTEESRRCASPRRDARGEALAASRGEVEHRGGEEKRKIAPPEEAHRQPRFPQEPPHTGQKKKRVGGDKMIIWDGLLSTQNI